MAARTYRQRATPTQSGAGAVYVRVGCLVNVTMDIVTPTLLLKVQRSAKWGLTGREEKMATAYHLEALRKQRVLERAVEARKRMQVSAGKTDGA